MSWLQRHQDFSWNLCKAPVFHPLKGKAVGLVPAFVVCEALPLRGSCPDGSAPSAFWESDLCRTLEQLGWKKSSSRVRCGQERPYDPAAAGLNSTTFVCYCPPRPEPDARSEWAGLLLGSQVWHPDHTQAYQLAQQAQDLQHGISQAESEISQAFRAGVYSLT